MVPTRSPASSISSPSAISRVWKSPLRNRSPNRVTATSSALTPRSAPTSTTAAVTPFSASATSRPTPCTRARAPSRTTRSTAIRTPSSVRVLRFRRVFRARESSIPSRVFRARILFSPTAVWPRSILRRERQRDGLIRQPEQSLGPPSRRTTLTRSTSDLSTNPLHPNSGVAQINPTTGAAAGRFNPATGTIVGTTFQTYNFNPFNIFQTPFQRYNIYGQANYEVSDSVEVYARGMFSKIKVSTIIAPSGSFGGTVTINLNNPFLPSALRQQFCARNVAAAGDPYDALFDIGECNLAATATGRSDPNYREVTVALNRRTPEVGPRISDYQTTFFDYRVGARGGITDSIDWNIEGSYGESENIQTIKGYTLQSRFREASLSNDGVTCQSGNADCVPINLFGPEGSITPSMAAFLTENSSTTNRTSLAQARAIISGDLGFASPGAVQPIGFAIGGEYRKYKAQQASDLMAKTPGELGGAGGAAPDIDGGYDVYEAYAEVVAPLIEDKPFFESLTIEAGIRYSDYSIQGGAG